jgi:hypothetical protein
MESSQWWSYSHVCEGYVYGILQNLTLIREWATRLHCPYQDGPTMTESSQRPMITAESIEKSSVITEVSRSHSLASAGIIDPFTSVNNKSSADRTSATPEHSGRLPSMTSSIVDFHWQPAMPSHTSLPPISSSAQVSQPLLTAFVFLLLSLFCYRWGEESAG